MVEMSAEWWKAEADRYCHLHIKTTQRIVELEAMLACIRAAIANQRAENRELIRQLTEQRDAEPVKLMKEIERLRSGLEQSKHRGKEVEDRLETLCDAIRDGHWKLVAVLVPPKVDPSDQRLEELRDASGYARRHQESK